MNDSRSEQPFAAAHRPSGIGVPQRRHNGGRFLTGQATFTADIMLPGLVHLAIARSTHAHAHLSSIDLDHARRHPEVLAALTGVDAMGLADPIPHNLDPAGLGGHHADIRCLAVDKVRYVGEPIAAVVAVSAAAAKAAAMSIQATYEPLPAVLDPERALAADACLLYEDWTTNEMIKLELGSGDPPTASSASTLSGSVTIKRSTSAPLEPRAYVADWNEREQRLTWYGTTQNPHPLRTVLAVSLRLDEGQIRVVMPNIGGSFGLKMHGHPEEVLVALMARLVGRPVRWVEDRKECMLAGGREQRHRFDVTYEPDGRITAINDDVLIDHGAAAAGPGWGMAFVGGVALGAGYDLASCRVSSRVVVTNKSPWTGVRGFGKETATVVMERIVDLVAKQINRDCVSVRRANLVGSERFPFATRSGLSLDSGDYHRLLDSVLEHVGYKQRRREQELARGNGQLRGIGIAFELTPEGADIPGALVGGADTTTVRMNASGGVSVMTGVTSPGNGNDTAIAQVVADRLGVALSAIRVVQGDSDLCPYGYGNLSSRSAVAGAGSAMLAADEIAAKLRKVAANMLHLPDETRVLLAEGMAINADEGSQRVPIAAVARAVYSLAYVLAQGMDPTLDATRTYRPSNIRHQPDANGQINPFHTFSYSVHAMIVDVDPETGHIAIHRHVLGHDCGTQLNPALVEGQLHGSVCAGLGAALCEELVHSPDGALITDSYKTYLTPRASEMSPVELLSQVTPSPYTPLGAKGVGESGLGGTQAALLNAVNDAIGTVGAEVSTLPLTPPVLLEALSTVSA
jgi:carbon-monoxide dehydrogenase large subunit